MSDYVPDDVKRRLYDAAVKAASQAARSRWPRVAKFLAWFHSDAEPRRRFAEALDRAIEAFLNTVEQRSPALANDLRHNPTLWASPDLHEALRAILTSPGANRSVEWTTLRQLFSEVVPNLAEDAILLDGTLQILVTCMAAEVSLLPEFRDLYRFEFERRAAQSTMQLAQHLAQMTDLLRAGGAVPPISSLPASGPRLALPAHRDEATAPPTHLISAGARFGVWALVPPPHSPTTIVVIGPDTRRVELLPTDATPDYSYLEFFGDKDTILEASVFLARTYSDSTLTRYPASWLPAALRSMPLVVVGGPNDEDGVGGNRVARQIMDHYELPITYHDDCEGLDYAGASYRTAFDSEGHITLDWGLVVRVCNPWNTQVRALLIQGVHTHGVLGAFRAITDPSLMNSATTWAASLNTEDPLFSALIRVAVLDGVATSATLDPTLIRSYVP